MTTWPSFTVAILSHRRPHLLGRVLAAVAQLDYPRFEIVVVGDRPNLADFDLPGRLAGQIRYRCLVRPNVARARNIAVEAAAGEIVAFCDDDAVPEPDWLRALAGAFHHPKVAAASGTVLAGNGRSVEWQGRFFSSSGRDGPVEMPQDGLVFADPDTQVAKDRYLGVIGANCAFRRRAIVQAGGFDEAYAYFLEETDMAIRLARDGWSAVFVAGAVVHHARAANASRTAAGVPRNLFQIAASKAHFCCQYLTADRVPGELRRFRDERLHRLDRHLRRGQLRYRAVRRLERQLERGLTAGGRRTAVLPLTPGLDRPAFARFHRSEPALRIALIVGWGPKVGRLRRLARRLAADGQSVSWIDLAPGLSRPRVDFRDGLWRHRSGTWRLNEIFNLSHAFAEVDRIAPHRSFDVILRPGVPAPGANAIALTVPGIGPLTSYSPDRASALSIEVREALVTALIGDSDNLPPRQNRGRFAFPLDEVFLPTNPDQSPARRLPMNRT